MMMTMLVNDDFQDDSDYHDDDSGSHEDHYHDNMNYEAVILSHVT